ncbi:DUF4974 domain-containing protein [Chitinophaga silvatica]|uniref:DUF4974 domain-containing protein n=1 Tax=Chitinophaga silvatica TaxID=2282649 RepID=A0A3E1Y3G7_9BACT|nr:FecR family protein [Chitinophaga silvatica]RFS19230.1 DUF4974 domain-containing protein [Chitinophaga silvatica]
MPTDDFSLTDHAFNNKIVNLLYKQLVGEELSAEEQATLDTWINQSAENEALYHRLREEPSVHKMLQTWYGIDRNRELRKAQFLARLADQPKEDLLPGRIYLFRSKIFRYTAAAVLVLGLATIFWKYERKEGLQPGENIPLAKTAPIAPGKDGAILTLADGSQVVLDSAGNGLVAKQNGASIVLQNGQLAYNPAGSDHGATEYNVVSTPKGRQFRLVLPDGSRVWLNAASSIRYPTAFDNRERRVILQGEAYFEIAANEKVPFKVTTDKTTEIEVLGTRFNVNAYTNENAIRTTLLEGAVKLHAFQQAVILKPGQQAAVRPAKAMLTVTDKINTEQVLAWKNGLFDFEDVSIDEVMRQLERWYDIEVVYEKGIPPTRFGGEINKQNTLQDVLQILEGSNVHFQLNGRKLIVMP